MFARIRSLLQRPPTNRRVRAARPATPASTRLALIRRWIVWALSVALLLAAAVALASFSRLDPAWSTTGANLRLHNWLGIAGAWGSDIGYFVLGASIWWVVVFLALDRWQTMPRKTDDATGFVAPPDPAERGDDTATRSNLLDLTASAWRVAGLLLLLVSSTALEALGMHRAFAGLPQGAGGALGQSIAFPSLKWLGFVPLLLLLIVLVFVGATLAFRIPWLLLSERLGSLLLDGAASWRARREEVREIKRDFEIAAPEVELRDL